MGEPHTRNSDQQFFGEYCQKCQPPPFIYTPQNGVFSSYFMFFNNENCGEQFSKHVFWMYLCPLNIIYFFEIFVLVRHGGNLKKRVKGGGG